MRKTGWTQLMIIAAIAVVASVALCAPPVEIQVTTNAVKILAERGLNASYGSLWVKTNLVAQGTVIRSGVNQYMAETDGRLGTNAPAFTSGTASNGAVRLRYVDKGQRTGFCLMLNSPGPVRVNVGGPAVQGQGIQLKGERSVWQESGYGVPQGPIWVVSDEGTNRVAVMEW